MFLNILLNAFQAIEQNGIVRVTTRQEDRRIIAELEDNGAGMSEEVQQHIFDLYFTTKQDGGGIGLAVSRNILKVHEGRISFTSTPGRGTKFTLDFPRKEKTTQINIPAFKNR